MSSWPSTRSTVGPTCGECLYRRQEEEWSDIFSILFVTPVSLEFSRSTIRQTRLQCRLPDPKKLGERFAIREGIFSFAHLMRADPGSNRGGVSSGTDRPVCKAIGNTFHGLFVELCQICVCESIRKLRGSVRDFEWWEGGAQVLEKPGHPRLRSFRFL